MIRRTISLAEGETIDLGRSLSQRGEATATNLRFDEKRLSRQHAHIRKHHGQWQVSDADSKFGTFLGDAFVPPGEWVDLHLGDRLGFVLKHSLKPLKERTGLARLGYTPDDVSLWFDVAVDDSLILSAVSSPAPRDDPLTGTTEDNGGTEGSEDVDNEPVAAVETVETVETVEPAQAVETVETVTVLEPPVEWDGDTEGLEVLQPTELGSESEVEIVDMSTAVHQPSELLPSPAKPISIPIFEPESSDDELAESDEPAPLAYAFDDSDVPADSDVGEYPLFECDPESDEHPLDGVSSGDFVVGPIELEAVEVAGETPDELFVRDSRIAVGPRKRSWCEVVEDEDDVPQALPKHGDSLGRKVLKEAVKAVAYAGATVAAMAYYGLTLANKDGH